MLVPTPTVSVRAETSSKRPVDHARRCFTNTCTHVYTHVYTHVCCTHVCTLSIRMSMYMSMHMHMHLSRAVTSSGSIKCSLSNALSTVPSTAPSNDPPNVDRIPRVTRRMLGQRLRRIAAFHARSSAPSNASIQRRCAITVQTITI